MSFGQIQKGAKVIDLGFSYSHFSLSNSSFFSGQSLIGFTIAENKLFYGGIRHTIQKFNFSNSDGKDQLTSLVVGYEKFIELAPKIYFAPFITGSFGVGETKTPSATFDTNNLSISAQPRLHYFINNKWSVVASVGIIQYEREVTKVDGGENVIDKQFAATLNATNTFFGIRLNLNNE